VTTTTAGQHDARRRLRALLQGSGILAVCIMAMNVSTFGFQFVAARLLGPAQYGGVGRMMAFLLMVSVVQLGLQATAARRVSAEPDQVRGIERVILAVSYRAAVLVGVAMLLLSPVVWQVLKLDSIVPALLIAVCAVPLTVMGGQAGILQGERRWRELAVLYLANGVPRLVIGTVAVLIRPTEGAAMAAVVAGQVAPVIVGWWVLRRTALPRGRRTERLMPAISETMHGSIALLAFFVLSNIDIILAGNILSRETSGLYAAGLIVTKVVLFLPQVVVVVAFPAMSTTGQRRRTLVVALAAVTVLGALCTLGSWLLSGFAMIFIGGDKYAAVQDQLWLFAVLGTLLAALQLLVYSVLARQHRSSAYLIWAAVAVLVGLGLTLSTLTSLVLVVAAVDAVLLALLLAVSFWHMRDDDEETLVDQSDG